MVNAMSNIRILTGEKWDAEYRRTPVNEYNWNPWIEALPPIMDEEEATKKIKSSPQFAATERQLPSEIRGHCIHRLTELCQPFSRHLLLEQAVSRVIRAGYKARNPLRPDFIARLREPELPESVLSALRSDFPYRSSANGFAVFGYSGVGKSTAIERILLTYPQVIRHIAYEGHPLPYQQVVWLKLDCPHDGSLRALCLTIFQAFDNALGTNYREKYSKGHKTIEDLILATRQLAWIHALGVLVIDEIQNYTQAKTGGPDNMLNYLVSLDNMLGVPVITVGTTKAIKNVTRQLRNARRATGQGDFFWDQFEFDDEWTTLVKVLLKYQWVEEPQEFTEDFSKVLYEESAGITDIAVKLYMMAQYKAIFKGVTLDIPFLKSIAQECLQLVRPMINALKSRQSVDLQKYEDLYVEWGDYAKNMFCRSGASVNPEDFDTTLADVGRITDFLVRGGIHFELAKKAAIDVMREAGDSSLPELNQQAFLRAIELQNAPIAARKVEPQYTEGDLRLLAQAAKDTGALLSSVLEKEGVIADVESTLAAKAAS